MLRAGDRVLVHGLDGTLDAVIVQAADHAAASGTSTHSGRIRPKTQKAVIFQLRTFSQIHPVPGTSAERFRKST